MLAAVMNTTNQILEQGQKPSLIVGLGATGESVARWLSTQGESFAMADDKMNKDAASLLRKHYPDSDLFLGNFDALNLEDYSRIIASPGVPPTMPLIQRAKKLEIPVIGDIELFAKATDVPISAVTGSNGKSTVVHMLSRIYADAGIPALLGGNFGIPALNLLEQSDQQRYILELSSFQLETTDSLHADVASVLNVSEDHMNRYEGLADYADAKGKIYLGANKIVVNRDDQFSVALASQCKNQVTFGLDQPEENQFGITEVNGKFKLMKGDMPLMSVNELKVYGRHNQSNALAALALAEAGGVSLESAANTLRDYHGLPHRTQWVSEIDGTTWLNDSKATNTGATIAALEGLDRPVVLIAGGQGKGADFLSMRAVVTEQVKAIILMGEDAETLFRALKGTTAISLAKDMDDAVKQANKLSARGDYVLLSPSCASFDQYSGFEARGDDFVRCVNRLAEAG